MSQTTIQGLPPWVYELPITIEGVEYFLVKKTGVIFENHAEGERADKIWVELWSKSHDKIQLQRWPAKLLHALLHEASKIA